MKKIFDNDVLNYLAELGIAEEAILELQAKEIKKHILETLKQVTAYIENEDWDKFDDMLVSPTLDDDYNIYNEHTFIDFSDLSNGAILDIYEAVDMYINIKNKIDDNKIN